jgi:hypothetical protein
MPDSDSYKALILKLWFMNKDLSLFLFLVCLTALSSHGRKANTLIRIQEVPGSNIVPETGYLDTFSVFFPSPYKQIPGACLELHHDSFLPHSYQFMIDLSYFHSALCNRRTTWHYVMFLKGFTGKYYGILVLLLFYPRSSLHETFWILLIWYYRRLGKIALWNFNV